MGCFSAVLWTIFILLLSSLILTKAIRRNDFAYGACILGLKHRRSLPFMKLPVEIRHLVYTQVIEADIQATSVRIPPIRPNDGISTNIRHVMHKLQTQMSQFLRSANSSERRPDRGRLNTVIALLHTNKQISDEVIDVFSLHHRVDLTIDPTQRVKGTFFQVNSVLLKSVRSVHLKISVTPPAMNADLHRNLASSLQWSLRSEVLSRLRQMGKLENLHFTIKATGNAHVNPVWLWLSVCDALLPVHGVAKSSCSIMFAVEQMADLRSNNLLRTDAAVSPWRFFCREGHEAMMYSEDGNVRKFAEGLAHGCAMENCTYVEQ